MSLNPPPIALLIKQFTQTLPSPDFYKKVDASSYLDKMAGNLGFFSTLSTVGQETHLDNIFENLLQLLLWRITTSSAIKVVEV